MDAYLSVSSIRAFPAESFGKTENPEGDDFGAKNCPAITSGGYLKGGHNASRHLRLPRRQ